LAAVGLDWGGPALPPRRGGADRRPLAFRFAAAESPGRWEAEELRVLDQEDCATWTQDMNDYDRDQWSRGRQLIGHAGRDGHVTLRVDLPTAGKYRLLICFTKAPNYGILEVSLDGKGIGGRFDGFHPRVVPSGRVDFGLVELTKGTHAVRFTVVGKNLASDNYYMGIDCLELRPAD
jgi:hypothetical protein